MFTFIVQQWPFLGVLGQPALDWNYNIHSSVSWTFRYEPELNHKLFQIFQLLTHLVNPGTFLPLWSCHMCWFLITNLSLSLCLCLFLSFCLYLSLSLVLYLCRAPINKTLWSSLSPLNITWLLQPSSVFICRTVMWIRHSKHSENLPLAEEETEVPLPMMPWANPLEAEPPQLQS